MNLEELMADLDEPVPWYEQIYDFFKYRLPFIAQTTWWDFRDRCERWDHKYAHTDVWNLNTYLAEIIGKMTEDLANETHGYPPDITPEQWDMELRKISNTFNLIRWLEYECLDHTRPNETDKKQVDEAFDLLKKRFWYLWD